MTLVKRVNAPWRLNPKILERVKEAAKKERRSQVDQVEIMLEAWLDKFEADNK